MYTKKEKERSDLDLKTIAACKAGIKLCKVDAVEKPILQCRAFISLIIKPFFQF